METQEESLCCRGQFQNSRRNYNGNFCVRVRVYLCVSIMICNKRINVIKKILKLIRLFHVISHILKWRGNPNCIVNFLLVAYLEFLYAWFFHQVCFREAQWFSFLKSQMVLFFEFCFKKTWIILLHQMKWPIKPLASSTPTERPYSIITS